MKRVTTLLYGITCYAIFFATFLYTVGFLTNAVVPKSVDTGTGAPFASALGINVALILLFGLQHSVMARPGFKSWWTRFVPQAAERSTYVLFSSLAMIALFWAWQPMATPIWSVEGELARSALVGLCLLGVAVILYSTFLIDHFDLFGLRQVFLYWRDAAYTHKRFATPGAYRYIRHPLYVGWMLAFWATPDMTEGHLLFAGLNTAYILIAIVFEERDLVRALGREYSEWRERTPLFVPRFGGFDKGDDESVVAADAATRRAANYQTLEGRTARLPI